jgi:hypothetical protein
MASRAKYPHVQRVESNFPANRAETGKFDRKFESSAGRESRASRYFQKEPSLINSSRTAT